MTEAFKVVVVNFKKHVELSNVLPGRTITLQDYLAFEGVMGTRDTFRPHVANKGVRNLQNVAVRHSWIERFT